MRLQECVNCGKIKWLIQFNVIMNIKTKEYFYDNSCKSCYIKKSQKKNF